MKINVGAGGAPHIAVNDVSLAARKRWHTLVAGIIGAWMCIGGATLIAFILGAPVVWWDLIHPFTLGAITTAVMAYSSHFTQALTRSPQASYRPVLLRIVLVQCGLVALIIDRAGYDWGILATGAVVVIIGSMLWHGAALLSALRGSLSGSFAVTVPFYLAACAFMILSAGLAAAAGEGLGNYSQLIAAHSRTMVWGFVWLSMLATVITLLPTLVGGSIAAAARARCVRTLVVFSAGLLSATVLLCAGLSRQAGLALGLCVVAAIMLLKPVVQSTLAHSHNGASWGVISSLGWMVGLSLADALALAAGMYPRLIFLHVVPALVGAGIVNMIVAVLSHVLPTLRGGGPDVVISARSCAQWAWPVRLLGVSLGAALTLVPSTAVAHSTAAGVVLMGLSLGAGLGTLAASVRVGATTDYKEVSKESEAQPSHTTRTKAGWKAWAVVVAAVVASGGFAVATSLQEKQSQPTLEQLSEGPQPVVSVDVTVNGLSFVPNSVAVPQGSRLVVNFTNTAQQVHDLKIGAAETGRVAPGKTVVLDAGIIDQNVEGLCTIAGHALQGMRFHVRVEQTAHAAQAGEVPNEQQRTAPRQGFTAADASPAADSGERIEDNTFEFHWYLTEQEVDIAQSLKRRHWLINGQTTGPLLNLKPGASVRITLINQSTSGHTAALTLYPDTSAGGTEETFSVAPGEEAAMEFTVPTGTGGAHPEPALWAYEIAEDNAPEHAAATVFGAMGSGLGETDFVFVGSTVDFSGTPVALFNGFADQYIIDPVEVPSGRTVRVWAVNTDNSQEMHFYVRGEGIDKSTTVAPRSAGFIELANTSVGELEFGNAAPAGSADLAQAGQRGTLVVR